jgi:hypothetical protein
MKNRQPSRLPRNHLTHLARLGRHDHVADHAQPDGMPSRLARNGGR